MKSLLVALALCQPTVTHIPAPSSIGPYTLSEVHIGEGHLEKGEFMKMYAFEGKRMTDVYEVPFKPDEQGIAVLVCEGRPYTADLIYEKGSDAFISIQQFGPDWTY